MNQDAVLSSESFKRKKEHAHKVQIKDLAKLDDALVNLVAVVIGKWHNQLMLEDGTGQVTVRIFRDSAITLGEVVLIIGRVNGQNVIADICHKVVPGWLKVRKLEFSENLQVDNDDEETVSVEETSDPLMIIKQMDKGEGVLIEDIIRKFETAGIQEKINLLISNGDIYEVEPGKIRVLE